jgi:hypothetical protein
VPVSFEAFRNRFIAEEVVPEVDVPDEVASDEAVLLEPSVDSP